MAVTAICIACKREVGCAVGNVNIHAEVRYKMKVFILDIVENSSGRNLISGRARVVDGLLHISYFGKVIASPETEAAREVRVAPEVGGESAHRTVEVFDVTTNEIEVVCGIDNSLVILLGCILDHLGLCHIVLELDRVLAAEVEAIAEGCLAV